MKPILFLFFVLGLLGGLSTTAPAQTRSDMFATIEAGLDTDAVQPGQQATLAVSLTLRPGYHAQSATPSDENYIPLSVVVDSSPTFTFADVVYPKGVEKSYPILGDLNIYDGTVVVFVPIDVATDAAAGATTLTGRLTLQVCDDKVCFAPSTIPFQVPTTIVGKDDRVSPANQGLFRTFDPTIRAAAAPKGQTRPRADAFGVDLNTLPLGVVIAVAFGVGILFNLVPCVLPVLPLKIMGFYESAGQSRGRSVLLATAFSAGIVATFAALAVVVFTLQLFGNWGQMFGNPIFAGLVCVVVLLFALNLFGAFEVVLPARLYQFTPGHDSLTGNFAFGVFTAVLSTPCTFGLFAGLLTVALSQGSTIAVLLLTTVGAGMASPYLLLSAFPQVAARFPRVGVWSSIIKQTMGFLLIATAIYFAGPFMPAAWRDSLLWWMVFACVGLAGIYLFIRTLLQKPTLTTTLASVIVAAALIVPALWITLRITDKPLKWVEYSDSALSTGVATGRPVIVKFTATWCANCHAVEGTVFRDPAVLEKITSMGITPIKADLSVESAQGWKKLQTLSPSGGIPLTAVYMPDRAEPVLLTGIYSSGALLDVIGSK
jgi:thiol:disulfide interchange protein